MTETKTRMQRWREDHPLAWGDWVTANGGYVIQLGGYRVFYGRCWGCLALVTTRRWIADQRLKGGRTLTGRWPSYCDDCRSARAAGHDSAAGERMRRLRAERAAFRKAQFARREPRHTVSADCVPDFYETGKGDGG